MTLLPRASLIVTFTSAMRLSFLPPAAISDNTARKSYPSPRIASQTRGVSNCRLLDAGSCERVYWRRDGLGLAAGWYIVSWPPGAVPGRFNEEALFRGPFRQSEEAEGALVMADDRNLTAHTYNERIAVAIFGRLPRHLATLEAWLRAMTARMPASR